MCSKLHPQEWALTVGRRMWHTTGYSPTTCMLYIALPSFVYNMGLCKPGEHVELDQLYLSEKATRNLKGIHLIHA